MPKSVSPRTRFVIVRIGNSGEKIWFKGRVDRGYRPDPNAGRATANLASTVQGRAFAEGDVTAATQASRRALGSGPLENVGRGLRVFALAPWLALATLLPLLFLLWSRRTPR